MAKSKNPTPTFVLTVRLKPEPWQVDVLEKRFELARLLFNDIARVMLKRVNRMKQDPTYREWVNSTERGRKKILYELFRTYHLSEFDAIGQAGVLRTPYEAHLSSAIASSVGSHVWSSVNKKLDSIVNPKKNKKENKIRFKESHQPMLSLEGKGEYIKKNQEIIGSRLDGIKFSSPLELEKKRIRQKKKQKQPLTTTEKETLLRMNEGCINTHKVVFGTRTTKEIAIPMILREKDVFAYEALTHRIKSIRIKREWLKHRWVYYAQFMLEGLPPKRYNPTTGEIKRYLGEGNVGIDIGTSSVAVVSNEHVFLDELAKNVNQNVAQSRVIQRKMDRSKRAMNPQNYLPNGVCIKGEKRWTYSNRYYKLRSEYRELMRKIKEQRKHAHEKQTNEVLKLGDTFFVEDMSWEGLKRRTKKPTINPKTGRFKSKKRYGRIIANKAPSAWVEALKRKATSLGGEVLKVNTYKVKASQYNHMADTYEKKTLGQRSFQLTQDMEVQRDMYSAYLIQHVDKETVSVIDREACFTDFENFKEKHDIAWEQAQNSEKPLSSYGKKRK